MGKLVRYIEGSLYRTPPFNEFSGRKLPNNRYISRGKVNSLFTKPSISGSEMKITN